VKSERWRGVDDRVKERPILFSAPMVRALLSGVSNEGSQNQEGFFEWALDPVGKYRELWESINGAGSWAKSPWIWVLTFKRVACP